MLDIFNNNAFSVTSMTDAINKLKFVPGRIGQLGLFSSTGITTTSVAIEENNGVLSLVAPTNRGGPGVTLDKGKRAQSFRALCALGRVKFPTFAPWWPAAKDHLLKFTGSGDDTEDDFADMCGLMGQAADKILKAYTPKQTNVIEPKVGTLAWTRWASDVEKRRRNQPGRIIRAM